jgi:hypothetical protein
MPIQVPKRLHLDRRAATIAAAAPRKHDDLLTTPELAEWWGVSETWLENGRLAGYGPPFRKMADRVVRYQVGDALKFLDKRTYTKTSQYDTGRRRKAKRGAAA